MEPNFSWVVYLEPNLESTMCPNKNFSNFSNLFPRKNELTSHFFFHESLRVFGVVTRASLLESSSTRHPIRLWWTLHFKRCEKVVSRLLRQGDRKFWRFFCSTFLFTTFLVDLEGWQSKSNNYVTGWSEGRVFVQLKKRCCYCFNA